MVRVTFLQAGAGDAHELCLLVQRRNIRTAAVAHAGTDTAAKLEHRFSNQPFIRHTTLDTLRNELLCALLEITVLRAGFHCAERTHAAINLELSALIDLGCARCLVTTSKQAAQHNNICACCQCLDNIAGILDAAVRNDRNIVFLCTTVYTERRPYPLTQVCMPFGVGMRWRLSKNVSLTAEYGFRKTWTDYLDDVSTTYVGSEVLLAEVQDGVLAAALADRSEVPNAVGIKRGDDSLDDWYSYFNLSLGMNLDMLFGWMRSKRCRN